MSAINSFELLDFNKKNDSIWSILIILRNKNYNYTFSYFLYVFYILGNLQYFVFVSILVYTIVNIISLSKTIQPNGGTKLETN